MEQVLSSESYPRTLLDGLSLLYERHSMVDCKLLFQDGESVMAHKCILASASKYLQTQIEKGAMSCGTLIIKSISLSDFLVLLEFMYTGQMKLSQSTVWGITSAAAILDIPDAIKLCKEFIDMKGGLVAKSSDRTSCENIAQVEVEDVNAVKTNLTVKQDLLEEDENIQHHSTVDYCNDYGSDKTCEPPSSSESRKKRKSHHKKIRKRRTSSRNARTRKSNKSSLPLNITNDDISIKQEVQEEAPTKSKKRPKKRCVPTLEKKRKTRSVDAAEYARPKFNIPYPKFKCRLCSQKTFHYSSLQMHLRIHQVIPVYLKSLHCTTKYSKVTVKPWTALNGTESYQCTSCTEIFETRVEARRHVSKNHRYAFALPCGKCAKLCANSKHLLLHKVLKHRNTVKELKYCSFCSRSFLYEGNLRTHLRIHGVEDYMQPKNRVKYYCRHCQRMLVNKLMYISHLTHHGLTEREVQLEFQEPSKVKIRSKIKKKQCGRKGKQQTILTCEKCDRHYTSMHHLNAHMKLKHNCSLLAELPKLKKSVLCEEEDCGVICRDMDELRSHMDVVHPLVVYECSLCRYKGKIKHMFERHISRVHEKQNDKICEFCGKSFLKSYHLRVHRMRHHGVEDPSLKVFECDEPGCKYQTFAMNILETHKQRHDKDKPFSCQLCSKKLKSKKNLEKHMKKIHERIRPFICEICGVDYGEESELKLHMIRHDNAKHFACQMCDYSTYSKSILESHMYVKHKVKTGRYKDMLKCEQCEFETPNPGKMEEHTNAHKNIRPHQCDKCDKAFFTKPTLKEHKKWVHDKVALKCPYCVFTAPVKSHLKKHIRVLHTHRDLKPYKCFYCDYRCNVSGNCRKHIVQKHKGFEIKWIKICDPPIPSLHPQPGEVAKAITNSGDTYIPKRGRKRPSGNVGQDELYCKSSSDKHKQEINFKIETLGNQYGPGGSNLNDTLLDGGHFRVIPGVIDNQQIDAASALTKLSKVDNICQQGNGSYSVWPSGNLSNQHISMSTSQPDNTYHMDNTNQLMGAQTYTEMNTTGNMNPAYIESINYMVSMATQQSQGMSRSRAVLPNFQSMLPPESYQTNQLHHEGRTEAVLENHNSNMPDVVPSGQSIQMKETE